MSAGRALAMAGVSAALFLGTLFGVGEVYVRRERPFPRAQVIRGTEGEKAFQHEIVLVDGEPTWHEGGTEERHNASCQTPDSFDVLMLGSSIFYGTSYGPDEVMSAWLQRALDEGGDGPWCVMNWGQPAFVSKTKLAVGREAIPRHEPELVLWELWHNDPGGFTMLGNNAYNLTALVRDEAGYPRPWPMPSAAHRWLFHTSRFYEYAVLALTPLERGSHQAKWDELVERTLPAVNALVTDHGGRLMLVSTPFLDVPFEVSAAMEGRQFEGYRKAYAWADRAGVPARDLAAALVGQDPAALRHDPCCHYNARGHEAVGRVLAGWVREARAAAEAAGGRAEEAP